MSLTLDEVTAISRRIAAEVDPTLHVVGVTATDLEGGRVELMITIDGCHREPCQIIVNLPRTQSGALQQALRDEFAKVLRQHAGRDG